jgi:hypothetical protein
MVYRLVLVSFLTVAVMLPLLWAAFTPHDARDMLESAVVAPRAGATQEADGQSAPDSELLPDSGSAGPAASPMIGAAPEQTRLSPPTTTTEAPAAGIEPPVLQDEDAQTEARQSPPEDIDPTTMAPQPLVEPSKDEAAGDRRATKEPSPSVEEQVEAPAEAGLDGRESGAASPEPRIGESEGSIVKAAPAPEDSTAARRKIKPSSGVLNKARKSVKGNKATNSSRRRDRRDGGWIAIMRDAKWLRDQ